jgi:glycine hydroxymethyltransferase
MTTRGMKEEEMMEIADLMHATLEDRTDQTKVAAVRQEVTRLTSRFPLP